MRHKRGKGNRRGSLQQQLNAGKMMNISRLSVLPKCVKFGDPLLVSRLRNAGKYRAQLPGRRTFQTRSRHLAYAKDLFLGQVNKVSQWIPGADTWGAFCTEYSGIISPFFSKRPRSSGAVFGFIL